MPRLRGLYLPLSYLPMLQHYRRAGDHDGRAHKEWDSCMFSHFTLEASGHNPRSGKSQRLKNRVEHKFVWYPEVHGEPACTGCGRCIRFCPASVDISRIVTLLSGREETDGAA